MSIPPPSFQQQDGPPPAAPSAVPPSLPPGLGGSGAADGVEYSGWWLRVAAALLDGLIIGAPLVAASIILLADVGNSSAAMLVRLLIGLAVGAAYYLRTLTRQGPRNGQTLGKQLVGIRVVRDDGHPIGPGLVVRRELLIKGLFTWFTLGIFELVDCLWPLGDATNRALHDKIVGTHVVLDPTRSHRRRTVFAVVGVALLVLFLMTVAAAIAIPTFLNQKPVSAQQNTAEVQALEEDMGPPSASSARPACGTVRRRSTPASSSSATSTLPSQGFRTS